MFETVYVEKEISSHPRTLEILSKVPYRRMLIIERYGEIFNRKGQNFRTQKKKPALILAKRYGHKIHPIPPSYGIGQKKNFYFSHLFNCPFDCSYCYLQGMFRSAHFVLFINYEEIADEIKKELSSTTEPIAFFSGYDADSLALESISGFLDFFLPFFRDHSRGFLEIRTKSTAIQTLLRFNPIPNCVVAYTISPSPVIKEYEPKTPSLEKRIEALQQLTNRGWKIGFRFDPILPIPHAEAVYSSFFSDLFSIFPEEKIDSVTLGLFRLPKSYYKNMKKIEAGNGLLPILQEKEGVMISEDDDSLQQKLYATLLQHLPERKIFSI